MIFRTLCESAASNEIVCTTLGTSALQLANSISEYVYELALALPSVAPSSPSWRTTEQGSADGQNWGRRLR